MAVITFIQDFAVVLVSAFMITLLFTRIKQPVVFGYLIAGILIGPYTLALISNLETINIFADLGIILLLYSLGLQFNIKKLRKVGAPAISIGTFEMFIMLAMGHTLGTILGWSYTQSIFLGSVLAISSTAVILKILTDMRALKKEHSTLILGILIIEDVGAVVLLTILGSLSMVGIDVLRDIILILFRISIFFAVTLVFGLKFVPPFINTVKETSPKEVLLLTSLGLCFALSSFSEYLGFSVALGAFMMGAIISESKCRREVGSITEPVKDVFASMFFISVGMLVNPLVLMDFLYEIMLISFLAVLVKVASIGLGAYLAGYAGVTALSAGLGMIPRGEFSFVIAKLGVDQGVVGPEFYLITVTVALVTTLIAPRSLASSERLADLIGNKTPIQIKSFFKYTSNWICAISGQLKMDTEAAGEFRRHLREILINVLIIIIIYQGAILVKTYALETFSVLVLAFFKRVGFPLPLWFNPSIVAVVLACVLSLPSIYVIIRNIQRLIDLSIRIASAKFKILGVEIVKNTLRNAIYVMAILIFSLTLLPVIVAEAVGHGLILDSSILIFIALSGYFFWRTIGSFHHSLDEMIRETLLADEESVAGEIENIIESLKEDRDFGLEKLEIPPGSLAVGKSLSEIKLRTLTGVTTVAIERGSKIIRNPGPSEIIKKNDTLLIMGTEEERKNAGKYLTIIESLKEDRDFGLEKLEIRQGSPVIGKTLVETKLRTLTGVTIIAIERGRETIKNPKPSTTIKEGDTLLIIGTDEERKNARGYLRPRD
jgi:CPA2 family monovalent cation:H+ antiporter-2